MNWARCCKTRMQINRSHGGIASNEENRHTRFENRIRGAIEALEKVKLQVQMSVDSYIAGPNGELDWMVWNWDDKLKSYVFELTEPVDNIILGRKFVSSIITIYTYSRPQDHCRNEIMCTYDRRSSHDGKFQF